jgi:hypothetical protein
MSFTGCVDNVELRRLRVDHDNALNNYSLAEFGAQGRAWECRASRSTRRPIRAQLIEVSKDDRNERVEAITTSEARCDKKY